MEKLIKYLNELGYFAVRGKVTVVAFNDAIIEMDFDEEENIRLQIQQFDEVNFKAEDINDLIDEAYEEAGLDWDDEDFDDDDDDGALFDEMISEFMSGCKFKINDTVTVKGYSGCIFEVSGIGRSDGKVYYYLVDQENEGNSIEAYEEDMNSYYPQPKTQAKQLVGGMLKDIADELLDEYNAAMFLYKLFGWDEFYKRSQEILEELNKIKL